MNFISSSGLGSFIVGSEEVLFDYSPVGNYGIGYLAISVGTYCIFPIGGCCGGILIPLLRWKLFCEINYY